MRAVLPIGGGDCLKCCLICMVVYVLVYIKASERFEGLCIIQRVRQRLLIKNWEKMCGAHDAINVDDGDVANHTKIIRGHDPHPVVGVGLITERRKPVNKCALVELSINCK